MHSAHGLPYSRVHAQMAAHSASWLSASVKHMVINPLSFACFRDPSPLSRGAQFGGILSRDQAHLCRRGSWDRPALQGPVGCLQDGEKELGISPPPPHISPQGAARGQAIGKIRPRWEKQNTSKYFLISWGHLVHDFYKCSSPVYRLSPECRQQQRAAPQYRSQGRSEIFSNRI